MTAARAMYPESSSMAMKKKRIRICGRNTITEPTPAQTPSRSSERNQPAGNTPARYRPEVAMAASVASMSGTAQVKIDWKTSATTAAKITGPQRRCSTRASSRCVERDGRGA